MTAINLWIDGIQITARRGWTVLEAASLAGRRIPHLCHIPGLPRRAVCRLCLVEVSGSPGYQPSCVTEVSEGMDVRTSTAPLQAARRLVMELLLSEHGSCGRSDCEVERVAGELDVAASRFSPPPTLERRPEGSDFLALHPERCIHCDRCIRACDARSVIQRSGRGAAVTFAVRDDRSLAGSDCVSCGDCAAICPAGAFAPRTSVRR